jgi:OOP family OmpA-OmpF porin
VDADGCVRVTDRDGDGVADAEDRCPDTPAGTRVDTAGCPLPKTVVLKGVNFETGSARLTANSARTLDNVVETLHSNPDLKVEIGGHTDSTGSAALNRHLSKQRAEAVRVYLVSKGANAESLTAVGYGPDKPLAENATPEGRAANRRVELKILNP